MKHSVAIANKAPYKRCPFLFVGDIFDSIDKAEQIGYDAVELHLENPDDIDDGQLSDHCEQSGMWVSSFATGTCALLNKVDFINPDKSVRDRAVELVSGFIKKAAPYKAGIIIGDMRGNLPENEDNVPYLERLADSMLRLTEVAEANDVNILIETINRYEKNYMNRVEELLEFKEKLGSSHVKMHLDLYHMNIEEPNMLDAIRMCKGELAHVHLADNTRSYPGQGALDFKTLLEAIEDTGFSGYYTLECLPIPNGHMAAAGSLAYLKALFADK